METLVKLLELAEALQPVIVEYLTALTSFIGTCAVIASGTGSKVDDKIFLGFGKVINPLLKLINIFGANFGKAKNVDDVN